MARALGPEGTPTPAGPLRIPRNLEELVASRVETLSAPARQLALAAAATSQPTLSVLASALIPDADVGAALLEAEEAGVLSSEDGPDPLPAPTAGVGGLRLGLGGAAEAAAQATRPSGGGSRRSGLATWPSRRPNPMRRSPQSSRRPPRSAARRGAPEAAAELFAAARRVTPVTHQEQLLSRGLGAAKALLAAGDVGGARKIANEAAAAGAAGVRAEAELLLGDIDWIGGSWASAVEHLETRLRRSRKIRRSRRGCIRSWSTTPSRMPPERGSSARSGPSRR